MNYFFQKYFWKNERPKRPRGLRIYETHVGIGTDQLRVGTYNEFKDKVLPRIVKQGIY